MKAQTKAEILKENKELKEEIKFLKARIEFKEAVIAILQDSVEKLRKIK